MEFFRGGIRCEFDASRCRVFRPAFSVFVESGVPGSALVCDRIREDQPLGGGFNSVNRVCEGK